MNKFDSICRDMVRYEEKSQGDPLRIMAHLNRTIDFMEMYELEHPEKIEIPGYDTLEAGCAEAENAVLSVRFNSISKK